MPLPFTLGVFVEKAQARPYIDDREQSSDVPRRPLLYHKIFFESVTSDKGDGLNQ